MTEKPLVSVIINCYNSEKYLRETIDSLIAQTYVNWEAIFWDNCSTDKTADIIASYQELRFRYFLAEKNTPLGEARNLAMEKVKGEYFCFLDSDDVWNKKFLSTGIDILQSDSTVVGYYSNYFNWHGESIKEHNHNRQSGNHDFKYILNYYGIGMSACILKTEIVKTYSIEFDASYNLIEDLQFFLNVLTHGDFAYYSEPLCLYRIHDSNTSTLIRKEWAVEYERLFKKLENNLTETGKSQCYEYRDLINLRNKMIYYQLENCISENKRMKVLLVLFKNKNIPIIFWSRIIFVLFGKQCYNLVKKCIK